VFRTRRTTNNNNNNRRRKERNSIKIVHISYLIFFLERFLLLLFLTSKTHTQRISDCSHVFFLFVFVFTYPIVVVHPTTVQLLVVLIHKDFHRFDVESVLFLCLILVQFCVQQIDLHMLLN